MEISKGRIFSVNGLNWILLAYVEHYEVFCEFLEANKIYLIWGYSQENNRKFHH